MMSADQVKVERTGQVPSVPVTQCAQQLAGFIENSAHKSN